MCSLYNQTSTVELNDIEVSCFPRYVSIIAGVNRVTTWVHLRVQSFFVVNNLLTREMAATPMSIPSAKQDRSLWRT